MESRTLSIVFSSALERLTDLNSSFDKGVLRVAYSGKNRNNSFIARETFEQCIDTIYNCPIVCNYIREDDEIGGHDVLIHKSGDGMKLINITQPVGVIPESANYWWEEIEDENGIHEYLCVDALLWKRQEAYEKIKRDGITDESMEIKVKDGKMVDGCYIINDFEFTAFCLLGLVEPCYESASLHVFSADRFKEQYTQMMREFKLCFENTEGGNEFLNDLKNNKAAFALTGEQFRDELIRELSKEVYETGFGQMGRYLYADYDGESQKVYAWDTEDWKLYGFGYSVNGDALAIDFGGRPPRRLARRGLFLNSSFQSWKASCLLCVCSRRMHCRRNVRRWNRRYFPGFPTSAVSPPLRR